MLLTQLYHTCVNEEKHAVTCQLGSMQNSTLQQKLNELPMWYPVPGKLTVLVLFPPRHIY